MFVVKWCWLIFPGYDFISKEFKLNPGAKIFSPSYTNTSSANSPTVPTVASMGHVPNNSPLVPVGAAQPENGFIPFSPHSSIPVKVIQYGNLTSGNGVTGTHLPQPVSILSERFLSLDAFSISV